MAALLITVPAMAQQGDPPRPMPTLRPQPAARMAASAVAIERPAGVVVQAPPTAVVLRAAGSAALPQSLQVTRQLALPALRAQPVVALQNGTADLAPVLANPQALFNVAQRLRASPAQVQVTAEETELLEIPQGLVLRSVLGYRLRPGACRNPSQLSALANVGVRCFTRTSEQARNAAFADPSDPRFVADSRQRAEVLRQAQATDASLRAGISRDIATLRTMLADPTQRAGIEAEVGASEAARLAALDDAQLEAEVVNTAETRIEQVMFVPARGELASRFPRVADFAGTPMTRGAGPSSTFAAARPRIDPGPLVYVPPGQAARPLDARVFLTGFTLGRDYEWRQRAEVTIKWCIVGCKATYYAEVYAGFGYGFGLRFPIAVSGVYRPRADDARQATLSADIEPIDGSPGDYAATGLPADKLFDGKELVAQFDAYAGAGYSLPTLGSVNVRFEVGRDFTDGLPPPFTGGQFRPPLPGERMAPLTKVFDDLDLIGGRANFGVVGAQVFPAVKAELRSDRMRMTLRDNVAGRDRALSGGEQEVDLAIDADRGSDFTIGDPLYNLGFTLTPGLNARLFVDIAVWSNHWDWQLWFPQVAVELPPGGVDFTCHAGTTCARNYRVSAGGVAETDMGTRFMVELDAWSREFDARWLPRCADETCSTGIRFVRTNAYLKGKQAHDADPEAAPAAMPTIHAEAERTAGVLVQESQVRLTRSAGEGWTILMRSVWSKRCLDQRCRDRVAALAQEMGRVAVERQKARPEASSLEIQGEIGREYGPKFQAEVDASKARTAAPVLKGKPLIIQPVKKVP